MARKLKEYNSAVDFHRIIDRVARKAIREERPASRYATVTTIDRVNRACTVTFPGDSSAVKVAMGSIQPLATGQTVRIAGVHGDRFIDDVMGPITRDAIDLQLKLGGTGQRTVTDAGTILWNGNLSAWGLRGPNFLTTATITISFPADGTVITGVGGSSNQTVAGGVINLAAGETLYYIPPWGTSGSAVAANFRIVGNTANFDTPREWLMIVTRINTFQYRWGTGEFDSELYGTRFISDITNSTLSTVYTNGGTEVGITVRWPPTGRGMILLGAKMKHTTAGEGVYAGYQIRDNDSSGTIQIATSDVDSAYTESGNFIHCSYFNHHGSGILVPGNKYYIRSMVRVTASGAGATVSTRRIGFIPSD